MKYVMLLVAGLFLLTSVVFAEETTRGNYTTPSTRLSDVLNNNEYIYHTHGYTDNNTTYATYDDPYGLGLDVKVFDLKKFVTTSNASERTKKNLSFLDSINLENKYDFNNQSYGVFLTLSVDLTSLYQK